MQFGAERGCLFALQGFSCSKNLVMTFLMTAQLTSERYLLKTVPPFVTAHAFCASRRVVRDIRGFLKCHWDQNFGIPYFYIFEHSL